MQMHCTSKCACKLTEHLLSISHGCEAFTQHILNVPYICKLLLLHPLTNLDAIQLLYDNACRVQINRKRCVFMVPLAQQVPREQRCCVFCASGSAEDEYHFVFHCPAYCAIRNRFTNIFRGPAPTLSSFFTLHDPKVIARFLRDVLSIGTPWWQHKLDITFSSA